mmetsp:Transcript_27783/g.57346  ORF Transcript_27783/g.57346 Transcript_27783/m.57346 type:complete len:225 (+) Transcript_27783:135-809(+)
MAVCKLMAAVSVVLLSMVEHSASVSCSSFLTCADCTCATPGYDVTLPCASGCAWQHEPGVCTTAADARASGEPVYYSLWVVLPHRPLPVQTRMANVRSGNTTCNLSTSPEAINTVAISGCLLVGSWIWYTIVQLRLLASIRDFQGKDVTDLVMAVRATIPADEVILTTGVGASIHKRVCSPCGDALCFVLLYCGLGLPASVWLFIGLPTNVDARWEFDFFTPIV